MSGVLVDACGWVALVEARINLDIELQRLFGRSELLLTANVLGELRRLQEVRPQRRLLLELLEARAEMLESAATESHADDELLQLACEHGWAVLTVDRDLKQRLHDANCPVVQVVAGSRLELIE